MISVCIATYNGEKYIEEQLSSILPQLSDFDEVIVSDDNSNDDTLNIINKISDKRIKVYLNNGERGYTSNFYNALSKAKGDYIFLSDQDDVWLPNKVKVVMEYLKKYDFVHTDSIIVDENLKTIENSHNSVFNTKSGYFHNLLKCRYLGCCMAFNSTVLRSIFPVPCYSNKYPHDLWIALISERYYKCISAPEQLLLYRRHGNNTSDGGFNIHKRKIFIRIISRFYYAFHVFRKRKIVKKIKRSVSYAK